MDSISLCGPPPYSDIVQILALVNKDIDDVKAMNEGEVEALIVAIGRKKPAASVVNPIVEALNMDSAALGNVAAKVRAIITCIE